METGIKPGANRRPCEAGHWEVPEVSGASLDWAPRWILGIAAASTPSPTLAIFGGGRVAFGAYLLGRHPEPWARAKPGDDEREWLGVCDRPCHLGKGGRWSGLR